VGKDGRIYVTDTNENVVISIDDMTGAGYAYFGYVGSNSLFKQPTGLWVDGSAPIYVASQNSNQIARFNDITGVSYQAFGGPGGDRLEEPIDVVVAHIAP